MCVWRTLAPSIWSLGAGSRLQREGGYVHIAICRQRSTPPIPFARRVEYLTSARGITLPVFHSTLPTMYKGSRFDYSSGRLLLLALSFAHNRLSGDSRGVARLRQRFFTLLVSVVCPDASVDDPDDTKRRSRSHRVRQRHALFASPNPISFRIRSASGPHSALGNSFLSSTGWIREATHSYVVNKIPPAKTVRPSLMVLPRHKPRTP